MVHVWSLPCQQHVWDHKHSIFQFCWLTLWAQCMSCFDSEGLQYLGSTGTVCWSQNVNFNWICLKSTEMLNFGVTRVCTCVRLIPSIFASISSPSPMSPTVEGITGRHRPSLINSNLKIYWDFSEYFNVATKSLFLPDEAYLWENCVF